MKIIPVLAKAAAFLCLFTVSSFAFKVFENGVNGSKLAICLLFSLGITWIVFSSSSKKEAKEK